MKNINKDIVIVGFQGEYGSYSESASKKLMKKYNNEIEYKLEPLRKSENVYNNLVKESIDFGVVALKNNYGGIVEETQNIMRNGEIIIIEKYTLKINHCVFLKNKNIKADDIKYIRSHEQALKQCKTNIKSLFKFAQSIPDEDTAESAKKLNEGVEYDNSTAVICSREAGIKHNLFLFKENVQDHNDNETEFGLILCNDKIKKTRFIPDMFMNLFFNENNLKSIIASFFGASVSFSLFLQNIINNNLNNKNISFNDVFFWISMLFSSLIFIFASPNFRRKIQYHNIMGYWIYFDEIHAGEINVGQHYQIPRCVIINRKESELVVKGWKRMVNPQPWFSSDVVLNSNLFKTEGHLMYIYHSDDKDFPFNGTVHLKWSKTGFYNKIETMEGDYCGIMNKTYGNLRFYRIGSKEKFLKICPLNKEIANLHMF